jgi:hypothetical protein
MTRTSQLSALLLLLDLVCIGCTSPQADSHIEGESSPTSVDFDLIELALLDLAEFDEFDPGTSNDENRSKIVLDAGTVGSSWYISEGQLRGESRRDKDKLIPPDVSADLRRRNPEKRVSLSDFKPKSSKVLVEDLSGVDLQFGGDFGKKYPYAKGCAEAWLPGFSDDGNTAVVRFFFGPTPHGATATCLLIKEDGCWKVKWRKTAYYV